MTCSATTESLPLEPRTASTRQAASTTPRAGPARELSLDVYVSRSGKNSHYSPNTSRIMSPDRLIRLHAYTHIYTRKQPTVFTPPNGAVAIVVVLRRFITVVVYVDLPPRPEAPERR